MPTPAEQAREADRDEIVLAATNKHFPNSDPPKWFWDILHQCRTSLAPGTLEGGAYWLAFDEMFTRLLAEALAKHGEASSDG
jgi:hypothetical protein